MKTIAIDGLNQPIDGGAVRDRDGWLRWAQRRATDAERRLGFTPVVGLFHRPDLGDYYRINWGAMPTAKFRNPTQLVPIP